MYYRLPLSNKSFQAKKGPRQQLVQRVNIKTEWKTICGFQININLSSIFNIIQLIIKISEHEISDYQTTYLILNSSSLQTPDRKHTHTHPQSL